MLLILLNNSCGAKAVERTGLDAESPTLITNPNPGNQTSNGNNTDNLNGKVAWDPANNSKLLAAIEADDAGKVKAMLSETANIDGIKLKYNDRFSEDNKEALVIVAADLDKPKALQALVDLKMNVNIITQHTAGKPAIAIAVDNGGSQECFDIVMTGKNHSDALKVRYGVNNRTFLMHMAASYDKEYYVKKALRASDLKETDEEGNTAIMIAYNALKRESEGSNPQSVVIGFRATAKAILLSDKSFRMYQVSKDLQFLGIDDNKEEEVLNLIMDSNEGMKEFLEKQKEWQNRDRPRLG